MFKDLGIGGRLLIAFLGISLFAVLAGAIALYSFLEVGKVLSGISQFKAPEAITSLEISRQAERMVRAAQAMLTVTNTGQQEQIHAQITTEGTRLDKMLARLKEVGEDESLIYTIDWSVGQLRNNLNALNDVMSNRLQGVNTREKILGEFREAYVGIQKLLSASITELDYELERMRVTNTAFDTTLDEPNARGSKLIGLLASRATVQTANQHLSTIYGVFLETQLAERAEQLPVLSVRAQTALGALDSLTSKFDGSLRNALKTYIDKLHQFIEGHGSIFARLQDEFSAETKARDALIENAWISEELSGTADQLVADSKKQMTEAISGATSAQQTSTWTIMFIVVMSLVCSTLIVWLYVGRNLIRRLTELSDSMESVAGGDLRVHLPDSQSSDEIGRMTKALTVFRDTAVEIEEDNLREIGQSRQRLMDAIESISEGFCYFDANDKLVVANSKFRNLMYPGHEEAVVEGMTFEKMVRNAAEEGYIKDAENRIEEWVTERMAKHRNPEAPHIQHRRDGRWVMVGERKTGDGGTVSIYSDISDLKQREEELTDKSNSMENLSQQIAKYLSPQVYDSIFTGKKEVKVSSHRRKLTVFFSDIVGFTETADQMESEDLTKLLNHYLTEMSQIATEHGATIDKYVGDAIVIFFGDPETRGIKQDALACVKMAIAMRNKMNELEGVWRDSGIAKPLQCRIGINTGFCTVGNFGSEDRLDYTIIGNGVNLASRLESAATPGGILIAYETYALVKDEIQCEKLGQIEVKGIGHPVETYQVLDTYKNLGKKRTLIREEFPKFNLKIDLEEMSLDERGKAASALNKALAQLLATKQILHPQSSR